MLRDEQVRRYARHVLLPDVGGVGQSALLAAAASIDAAAGGDAAVIAATYLAAGGVGTVALAGASDAAAAEVDAHGPDTRVVRAPDSTDSSADRTDGPARPLDLPAPPPWWPGADGDAVALAFWRGGLAATRWMAAVANPDR